MTNTQKFESAWTRYIEALKRADALRASGRKPRYAVRRARWNLIDVCAELGIETPRCVATPL